MISLDVRNESYLLSLPHDKQEKIILKTLNKYQREMNGLTAHDISSFTGVLITSVRRALTNLKDRELVTAISKRYKDNRPSTVFYLTEAGERELGSAFI